MIHIWYFVPVFSSCCVVLHTRTLGFCVFVQLQDGCLMALLLEDRGGGAILEDTWFLCVCPIVRQMLDGLVIDLVPMCLSHCKMDA